MTLPTSNPEPTSPAETPAGGAAPGVDPLSPAAKAPAEGARGSEAGAPAVDAPDESHLGAAGDPAEGARRG